MYYRTLDILRFASAVLVALGHYFLVTSPHPLFEYVAAGAVEIFFVLSGYVLAPQILRIASSNQKSKLVNVFLIRRWIRTIPPYLLALTLAFLISSSASIFDFAIFSLYAQNLIADNYNNNFFPVAWSLSVEEWSYVAIPILLIALNRFRVSIFPGSKNDVNASIITLGVFLLAIKATIAFGLYELGVLIESPRRSVFFRIDAVFIGLGLHCIVESWLRSHIFDRMMGAALLALLASGSVLAATLYGVSAGLWLLFAPAAAMFLIALSISINSRVRINATCSSSLAGISYPIYLYHISVLQLAASFPNMLAAYVILTLLISTLSFYGFERPLLKLRPGY